MSCCRHPDGTYQLGGIDAIISEGLSGREGDTLVGYGNCLGYLIVSVYYARQSKSHRAGGYAKLFTFLRC
jgi:hypothetical protein